MKKKLVVLKLGGSVITHKAKNLKKINQKNLERLCLEIANAKKKDDFSLVIVHGGGSFGHIISQKFKLNEGYKNKLQIKPITDLHLSLNKLSIAVIKALKKYGLNAVSFSPSSAWKLNMREMRRCDLSVIRDLIKLEIIPVLHGDLLMDASSGFSILSGDYIVYHLAKNLKADRVFVGTDIDGVFDSDPGMNKNAKLIKELDKNTVNSLKIEGSRGADVTGGMKGKVRELLKLASCKIESNIINIAKSKVLEKSLMGKENFGTRIAKS
jgi:isopentenyl phosphate kinase